MGNSLLHPARAARLPLGDEDARDGHVSPQAEPPPRSTRVAFGGLLSKAKLALKPLPREELG